MIAVDTQGSLKRYAGGVLTISCRYCDHRGEMPVSDLAARIGWDAEIDRPRRLRLKCSRCGHKSPALQVSYYKKPRSNNRH